MAIDVNINVQSLIPKNNENGLILVIFRNARFKDEEQAEPLKITSVAELKDNFEYDEGEELASFRELYNAEYLLKYGATLLCYAVETKGGVTAGDINVLQHIEDYNYKVILVPYLFYNTSNSAEIKLILDMIVGIDAEVIFDLEPFAKASSITHNASANEKTQVSKNFGELAFKTELSLTSTGLTDTKFSLEEAGAYADGTDFVGVGSASALALRKALLIEEGRDWEPVAGEDNGLVNEFVKLLEKIPKKEKEDLQAKGINVLISKLGVGNLFVSQNTLIQTADKKNPLLRSHVVTQLLNIKRKLKDIAEGLLFKSNNKKTWSLTELTLRSFFSKIKEKDGLEEYGNILVGLGVTMTEEDIREGILRIRLSYLPNRVIENIEIAVTIQQTSSSYDIEVVSLAESI